MEPEAGADLKTAEEWGQLYSSRRSSYVDFTRRVESLVNDLLRTDAIDVIQVEARTKTIESFVEKIKRKGRTDEDPLSSIMDIVGIRIITYYLEDVDRVGHLLTREFSIDDRNSADKAEALASDQFGYRSAHYVCTMSETRGGLIEWQAYKGLGVEFQVRTALQHAWAAVSHKLEYKTAQEAPERLRRRLYRLSALFELADDQFSSLRDESEAATAAYRVEVGRGELDVSLDTSSLHAYWSLTPRWERLQHIFAEGGMTIEADNDVGEERLKRDHSDLVARLKQHKIMTLASLDEYLQDEEQIRRVVASFREANVPASGSLEDLLTMVLIVDRDDGETPGLPLYTEPTSRELAAARSKLRAQPAHPST